MSKLNNVMKPDPTTTKSSCVSRIQAFSAWMHRDDAIIGTEGMCQEIQH